MTINIQIKFDDDEKLLFKNLPDGVLDDAVRTATEKGFTSIQQVLLDFMSYAQIHEWLGNKEGDFS